MINKYYSRIDYLNFLRLTRPKQWLKNLFVFSPLIFSAKFYNIYDLINTLYCFILFIIASATVYIINDIYDYESDKKHPIKKNYRPIAAEKIKFKEAIIFYLFLSIILFVGSIFFNIKIFFIILLYRIFNIFYSIKLKLYPFIDIAIISIGFILRILCGAESINVEASKWILITTFTLGIYLSSIKRFQEINLQTNIRLVFNFYNEKLLKQLAKFASICTLFFYSLYCIYENYHFLISIPVVGIGLYRYWIISFRKNKGESPTDTILEDRILLLIIFMWILIVVYNNI